MKDRDAGEAIRDDAERWEEDEDLVDAISDEVRHWCKVVDAER
jgi:hypothetical protein